MSSSYTAIVGNGARGQLFIIGLVTVELAKLISGKTIDRRPAAYVVFEAQHEREGPGNAFQLDSEAPLNTGLPGPVAYDRSGLSSQQIAELDDLSNLAKHYADIVAELGDDYVVDLAQKNIFSAILLNNAFRADKLNTALACGPRYVVGLALERMTNKALNLVEERLPWLTFEIHYSTDIIDIDLSTPSKPVLTIYNKTDLTVKKESFDLVIKATGTAWKSPIEGDMKAHAYTSLPNHDELGRYLHEMGLIDHSSNHVKPGKRIYLGGARLSAFDYIGSILSWTNIVVLDRTVPHGFTINESEAKRYPGLITLFSRSQGDFIVPRHSSTTPMAEADVLFTPQMILSQQIDKDDDIFAASLNMARIVTAQYFNKLPSKIEPKVSTVEQVKRMLTENEALFSSPDTLTETGVFQKAFIYCLFVGSLGTSNTGTDAELAKLTRDYPLVVRSPWNVFRATTFSQTHQKQVHQDRNAAYQSSTKLAMSHVVAAPHIVHLIVTRLFSLGVIQWKQEAYEQISWSPSKRCFILKRNTADALISPRLYTAEADILSQRILSQTRKPMLGDQVYKKGRFPTSRSGEVIHVVEFGLAGHGRFENAIHLNSQWLDTNSYAAAHQVMPIVVRMSRIIHSLVADKVSNAVEGLMDAYRAVCPDPSLFHEQAAALSKDYHKCLAIFAFAELLETVYRDGPQFSRKMAAVASNPAARETIALEICALDGESNSKAYAKYEKALSRINFQPKTLEEFEKCTPDFSEQQIAKIELNYNIRRQVVGNDQSGYLVRL